MFIILSISMLLLSIISFIIFLITNIKMTLVFFRLSAIFLFLFVIVGVFGFILPIETKYEYPKDAFIKKINNSIVIVVPDIGNRKIEDPVLILYLTENDTVIVQQDYNSYGIKLQNHFYIIKNGHKY